MGRNVYAILTDLYYMYLGRLHSRTTIYQAWNEASWSNCIYTQ